LCKGVINNNQFQLWAGFKLRADSAALSRRAAQQRGAG